MKTRILCIIGFGFMFFSCTEKKLEPIGSSKNKPAPVTEVYAKPTPGGALISFVVPADNDVLSVKAVYKLTNGKTRESIASFYNNSLNVEGYNDVWEHEVLLYTVNRAQQLSDPILVRFTPLESTLSKAVRSINIISDFGGVNFSWKNEDQKLLTAEMVAATDDGKMETARIETSKLNSTNFTIRGYDAKPRKFGIILTDNWDNVSDTIYPQGGKITPLIERKLDKSGWSTFKINSNYLSGDVTFTNWEGRDEYLFDDDPLTFGHSYSGSLPAVITIDIGKKAMLSRVLFFQRGGVDGEGSYLYRWGNARRIIVYARENAPTTGNWNE